jgi:ferrous iron transport protein B
VGKSTLFNLLTGASQKTMNAPRTTVSFAAGHWKLDRTTHVQLVDLPGTYSLIAQSPDEAVTAGAVSPALAEAKAPARPAALGPRTGPDLAIAMVDANAPASSLYLLGQLALLQVPVIVALSMADVARGRGIAAEPQLLAGILGVPVVEVNPRRSKGAADLAAAVKAALEAPERPRCTVTLPPAPGDPAGAGQPDDIGHLSDPTALLETQAEPLFEWVSDVIGQAQLDRPPTRHFSDRVDHWLLTWWIGLPVFLAVLWGVFELTTVVAAPLQDLFEGFVTETLAGWLSQGLAAIGWGGGWLESLLVDGVLAGVGVVVSFLPLMAIMFLAIALLEDSGYMARAALVADRAMRGIGLDGRAVLPLVIGFGCNLPALAATKTLPNARQRLLTGLLVPYASCTARLVIFLFMASVFFPEHAGTVVFGMYLVSGLLIVLIGLALRGTAFRGVGREPLILVLPPYQVPRPLPLARSVVLRCRDFTLKAGQVILILCVAIWGLLSIPTAAGYSIGPDVPAEHSVLGVAAKAVAPVFAAAGFDDWHATASLMTGFVAKEAAVGTLATTFGMEEPEDPSEPGTLADQVWAALDRSSGGHPGPAALAYMFFALGYTPCMVTVAEMRRLFGWKPVLRGLTLSLVLSWVLAVLVYQIGALL